jgi:alpha-tubulin suppressor-like RCC1 family protein
MALTTDGAVWTWGEALALGNGSTTDSTVPVQVPGLTGVTQIAAGNDFDLALRSDGSVWGWGANGAGELGTGTPSLTPVAVPCLAGVTQISAGEDYSLAVHQVVLIFVPGGVPGTLGR